MVAVVFSSCCCRSPCLHWRLPAATGVPTARSCRRPRLASGEITADIYDGDHPDINVYVGARIRWRNLGDIAHSVTAKDGSFDTGPIEEGRRTGYILFPKAGKIEYYDKLNPGMEGRIQVFEKK